MRWRNRDKSRASVRLKIKGVMSLKGQKKALFSFSSSLNHKMPQHSPLTLFLCQTQIRLRPRQSPLTFVVKFQLSSYRRPRAHTLTGGTQRVAAWKWILKFWENRLAPRYRWWKALRNLGRTEKKVEPFHFKDILFSASEATKKAFTWW